MELTIEVALALYGVAALIVIRFDQELRLPGELAGGLPSIAGKPLTGQVAHHDSHGISR